LTAWLVGKYWENSSKKQQQPKQRYDEAPAAIKTTITAQQPEDNDGSTMIHSSEESSNRDDDDDDDDDIHKQPTNTQPQLLRYYEPQSQDNIIENIDNNNHHECFIRSQNVILPHLQRGRFIAAKIAALQLQNEHPECERSIAKWYTEQVDDAYYYYDYSNVSDDNNKNATKNTTTSNNITRNNSSTATRTTTRTTTARALSSILARVNDELDNSDTTREKIQVSILSAPMDAVDCWNPAIPDDNNDNNNSNNVDLENASNIVLKYWDLCCSQLSRKPKPASTTSFSSLSSLSLSSSSSSSSSYLDDDEKECFRVHKSNTTTTTTTKWTRMCCGLYQESLAHLRLPALQELSLNVRLQGPPSLDVAANCNASNESIILLPQLRLQVHQDGFLRKYDPAGVLWPTAYLLSLCLIDVVQCGILEVKELIHQSQPFLSSSPRVSSVELGAGVGLPSLVMSYLFQQEQQQQQQQQVGDTTVQTRVLATDRALHGLVLTHLNSRINKLPVQVAYVEDHSNVTQLVELKNQYNGGTGFSIVLGSSLQSLFDYKSRDPRHKLWAILDTLLEDSNPNAIVILSHVVGAVIPPSPVSESVFERVHSISGNEFGMRTRSGDDSDFEISVYRRRRKEAKEDNDTQSANDEL